MEKHQETLRSTIAAQKSLINEQQLSNQVHNNIAMMFLDEIVDDGESVTVEEQANRVSQLKDIHDLNNKLQKQVQGLTEANKQLKEQVADLEGQEKWNVSRIKSLEGTLSELEGTKKSLMAVVDTNKGLLDNLNEQLKEKDSKIDELDSQLKNVYKLLEECRMEGKKLLAEKSRLEDVDKLKYEWGD